MSKANPFKIQAIDNNEKWIVFGLLTLYLILASTWHLLTDAPWDDDCVTRYYNVTEALIHPENFISLWNRPLFVVLFFIPFQLGKAAILLMALISAFNAYILYLVARKLNMTNAFLVIPLLLFQAFFFTISRSALAEPLAATLISLGFFFYLNKRFLYFALIGSLLPLARLELSVFLFFWVYILILNKQWKYIFVLAIPTLIWSIAGSIMEGGIFWLYEQTLGNGNVSNRYGHTDFWHYFQRYIYFLNPIVFYFFLIGLVERSSKRNFDIFLVGQFILGFTLYVVFSWKLNLGQAAGFLRHMATLSPLAALLALYGYNYWLQAIPKPKKEMKGQSILKIILYSMGMIILSYFFFSQELILHHTITVFRDYKNLIAIISICILLLLLIFYFRNKKISRVANFSISLLLIISVMGFTLLTEKPDIHNSPERETMETISDLITANYSNNYEIYVNHIWFYWANDLERNSKNYRTLSFESISKADDSALFIWENHYSNELGIESNANFFQNKEEYLELFRMISSDSKFITIIYQKTDPDNIEVGLKMYDYLIVQDLDIESLYYNRANYSFNKLSNIEAAISDYSKAISLNKNYVDAYYNRALAYYNLRQFESAIKDLNKVVKQETKHGQAFYYYGDILSVQGNYSEAIIKYSKVIELKPDHLDAYLNRAVAYFNINEFEKALADYNKLISLNPQNMDQLYYSKAIVLLKLGETEEACVILERAKKMGNSEANKLIQYYCLSSS